MTARVSSTSPRTARGPAAAAQIAGARAGPCTAVIGGARPICPRSGGRSGWTCACAGFTAATRPALGAPSPSACPSCSDPTRAAPAGWSRPRGGSGWHSGAKLVRACSSTCPCRRARTRCCVWCGACCCPSRSRRASWAWTTGRCARGARTAPSWWTWSAAACWTSSPTGPRRCWPTGCGAGRGSRWSHETARPSTRAASSWARRRRRRSPTAGTCWPTCGRCSSVGWPGRTCGCGACRPGLAPPPTRGRAHGPNRSRVPGPSGQPVAAAGSGGLCSTRRSGGGTPR